MRRDLLRKEIELTEGVSTTYADGVFTAKGPKGEVSKKLLFPGVDILIEEGKIAVEAKNAGKKEKMYLGTSAAHIKNMVKGVVEGYNYKLKICSGHFPMNVKLSGNKFSVVNYLGEKVPRLLTIKEGATVKVEGDIITVDANNIELAGQVAADIELLTRLSNKDRRIYQDGIFITEKNGKEV